jgi:hypothetical protein
VKLLNEFQIRAPNMANDKKIVEVALMFDFIGDK